MVDIVVTINESQAGTRKVDLPDYAGVDLVITRGGLPQNRSKYSVLSTGGFELALTQGVLQLNEEFGIFPQPLSSVGINGGFGVSQYPHTMSYATVSDSEQNGDGNWTDGTTDALETKCRYEPSTKPVFVEAADGQQIRITGMVYMPLPALNIQPGTRVQVFDGVTVLSKETVKRYSAGQLNQRIWL